ncbi:MULTISPECIES: GNAT family N-acetyltransferase [unclassified Leucobacter]|uniref:GNAT family N-acetyltransferase n=1 Tax=unclassified Leucobacter TaxID=2621730 RepID=UPI001BFDDA2C|nr:MULTISPECIES: GNAT family protein [unclassified Leucobacter]
MTKQTSNSRITFTRLPEIPIEQVTALLNEPRNSRHMPLATAFTPEQAADWVRDKDAQWAIHGFGPWAILVNGEFAGWGGFEAEADSADFALVLLPGQWGMGEMITRKALETGFEEFDVHTVTIALPYSRQPTKVVGRLGFNADGEVIYGGERFRRYKLYRQDWCTA